MFSRRHNLAAWVDPNWIVVRYFSHSVSPLPLNPSKKYGLEQNYLHKVEITIVWLAGQDCCEVTARQGVPCKYTGRGWGFLPHCTRLSFPSLVLTYEGCVTLGYLMGLSLCIFPKHSAPDSDLGDPVSFWLVAKPPIYPTAKAQSQRQQATVHM